MRITIIFKNTVIAENSLTHMGSSIHIRIYYTNMIIIDNVSCLDTQRDIICGCLFILNYVYL